jgi:anti-sigma B factor antagonist
MISVEQRSVRDIIVLDLIGTLTSEDDGRNLDQKVLDCCSEKTKSANGPNGIILNFEQLKRATFGNYGEFPRIVSCYTTASLRGFILKLLVPDQAPLSKSINNFLAITQLITVFEVFETEKDAVNSFLLPSDQNQRFSLSLTVDLSGRIGIQVLEKAGAHEVMETAAVRPALHGIWFPDFSFFPSDELERFKCLLNKNPPAPEAAFQEFLEANPRWLYLLGEQYEKAVPQVRLPPLEIRSTLAFSDGTADSQTMIPDFLVKRIGLDLWDVLDIKKTDARIVVGTSARRRFSNAVAEAVAQLREYSRRLRTPEVKQYLFERHGMVVSEPVAMVVIGRDFSFSSPAEKDLFREQDRVKIYTYDDLYRLAKRREIPFPDSYDRTS